MSALYRIRAQFHRALDAVTKVMKNSQRTDREHTHRDNGAGRDRDRAGDRDTPREVEPICTVVTPSFNKLLQDMWQPQIRMVMLSDKYPRYAVHCDC